LKKRILGIGCTSILVLALVWWFWPWGCPAYYEQDPIRIRVVDKDTGAPIEGAAVVAVWMLSNAGWETQMTVYRYEETATDRDGWFQLSGWKRWRKRTEGRLKDLDPEIDIYKPGYRNGNLTNKKAYVPVVGILDRSTGRTKWEPTTNIEPSQMAEKYPGWRWPGAKRYFYWNGRVVGLEKLSSPEETARMLEALAGGINVYSLRYSQLPIFWKTWNEGWATLPPALRETVPQRGEHPGFGD